MVEAAKKLDSMTASQAIEKLLSPKGIMAIALLVLLVLIIFGAPCLLGWDGWLSRMWYFIRNHFYKIQGYFYKKNYKKKWGLEESPKEEQKPMEISRFNAKKNGLTPPKEGKLSNEDYQHIASSVAAEEAANHGIPLYDHQAPAVNSVINGIRRAGEETPVTPLPVPEKEEPTVHRAAMLDLTPEEPEGEPAKVDPVDLLVEEPGTTKEKSPEKTKGVEVSNFGDFTGEVIVGQKWVQPESPDKKKGEELTYHEYSAHYVKLLFQQIRRITTNLPGSDIPQKLILAIENLSPECKEYFPMVLTKREMQQLQLWKMGYGGDSTKIAKSLQLEEDTVLDVLCAFYEQTQGKGKA